MNGPSQFSSTQDTPWTREEFEAQLRAKGTAYHIHHPFNVKMNSGGCSREQIRGFVPQPLVEVEAEGLVDPADVEQRAPVAERTAQRHHAERPAHGQAHDPAQLGAVVEALRRAFHDPRVLGQHDFDQ